jgi:UDPglucose 6-dehydrogenase
MANVVVVGLGYVGLTTMVGLAGLGHRVLGLDVSEAKVSQVENGEVPFFEEGLSEALVELKSSELISFSSSYDRINENHDFAFICVSTPQAPSGAADLSMVNSAVESLSEFLSPGSIIVMKSTVPVGTCSSLANELTKVGLQVVSNPEFLAEGRALQDFAKPSRIVVGSQTLEASERVMNLYKDIECPKIHCELAAAELIKHGSNAFLALKLSFVNELAALSEAVGADITAVTAGLALDPRIGERFLQPGPGWGGSCFPKDTQALAFNAETLGVDMKTVKAAIASNEHTMGRVVKRVSDCFDGNLQDKKIAVWGLSFKAGTDDTRESPAVAITRMLIDHGAKVLAFDPMAKLLPGDEIVRVGSEVDACVDADALLVLTEWDQFSRVDPNEVKAVMSKDPLVLDFRRVLDGKAWKKHFETFLVVGQ